jgi:hypothetical protein
LDVITAISSFQDLNERLRPFILKLGGQGVDIDSGLR